MKSTSKTLYNEYMETSGKFEITNMINNTNSSLFALQLFALHFLHLFLIAQCPFHPPGNLAPTSCRFTAPMTWEASTTTSKEPAPVTPRVPAEPCFRIHGCKLFFFLCPVPGDIQRLGCHGSKILFNRFSHHSYPIGELQMPWGTSQLSST